MQEWNNKPLFSHPIWKESLVLAPFSALEDYLGDLFKSFLDICYSLIKHVGHIYCLNSILALGKDILKYF